MYKEFFHKHPFMVLLAFLVVGILIRDYCFRPVSLAVPEEEYLIRGRCTRELQPGQYLIQSGKYTLFLQSRDTNLRLQTDDSISCIATLVPLKLVALLHEFNYDNYLKQWGVDYRILPRSAVTVTGKGFSLYGFCQTIRDKLIVRIDQTVADEPTRRLLKALCLGYRQGIQEETRLLFQETGTIHLLAVSGLHMGAVYLLLGAILQMLYVRSRFRGLLLIPLIWLFAGITGLSPSACRAAAILSFIETGKMLRRDYLPLNAIAASAFFTLLLSPHLLYSVSFQMSYAAYTGIILILPLLRPAPTEKRKWLKYIHALVAVSLAAQIAILPLSIYYFNSFNLTSILVNIIAVPLASLLLYSGVILLILPTAIATLLAFIPTILTHLLFSLLNLFAVIALPWVSHPFTFIHLLALYGGIIITIIWLYTRRPSFLYALCLLTAGTVAYTSLESYRRTHTQELIVYNRYGSSCILLNYQGRYTILKRDTIQLRDEASLPYIQANGLKPLPPHNGFISIHLNYEQNHLTHPDGSILLLSKGDSLPTGTPTLIITGNLYPNQLPQPLPRYQRVIADRSNSRHCTQAWKSLCETHDIPFTATAEDGPVIIPLNK